MFAILVFSTVLVLKIEYSLSRSGRIHIDAMEIFPWYIYTPPHAGKQLFWLYTIGRLFR